MVFDKLLLEIWKLFTPRNNSIEEISLLGNPYNYITKNIISVEKYDPGSNKGCQD